MLIGFAVSGLAIYYLLQQVQLDRLAEVLGTARLAPLILLVLTVLVAVVTRALRWRVCFEPDRHVRFATLLRTVCISYMPLPLRAGEVLRAFFTARTENVAVPRVVGTILLEKLFDFLAIGVMLAGLVAFTPMPVVASVAGSSIATVILLGFGFVVALAIWRQATLRAIHFVEERLPLGLGRKLRLENAARQFAQGTDSLRQGRLWVLLLVWTTVTWLCSIGSTWAGFAALSLNPGVPAMLFVIVLTSATQAVPSSPGYVGVYHAAAVMALSAFGVDAASALAFAVVAHAFSYGTLVVCGLIALWTGGYSFADLRLGLSSRPSIATRAEPLPVPDA